MHPPVTFPTYSLRFVIPLVRLKHQLLGTFQLLFGRPFRAYATENAFYAKRGLLLVKWISSLLFHGEPFIP